ncbi:cation diffusion facilitator family transporter [Aestuariivirga sp.]|uniref:cation diffusion facilitator family transporter n=1 Tax=Aestuariivirga sp. TaxID=2650926 RepID=UPI003BACFAA7
MSDHHDHAGHEHGHSHSHAHAPASFGRAFAIGTVLNLGFVAVEVVYGFLSNSVALLADAGHNLSDALGLVMAWVAYVLARRLPSRGYTFGLGKSSILAALFNAVLLLVAVGGIGWEAIQRLFHPEPVAAGMVMVVAAVGILINGATAMLFISGRKGDLNIHAAFMHMIADVAVSAGVVVAGLVILYTGWLWVDPAMSMIVNIAILWATWGILRQSLTMALMGVPSSVDLAKVQAFLKALPGVAEVHDLHVWPLSTTETALSCHLVMPGGHPGDHFLLTATEELKEHFGIGHPTFQVELDQGLACPFAPDEVV